MWYEFISLLSHEFSIVPNTKQIKAPAGSEGKLHWLYIKITQILGSSNDYSLKQFSSISEDIRTKKLNKALRILLATGRRV